MDDVLGTAHSVAGVLAQQRQVFESVGGRMAALGARFPVVNSLMNAIRRRKNRDNVVLGGVAAACLLFILVYWANK
jgi:golgi SNAP receptor complex member 1